MSFFFLVCLLIEMRSLLIIHFLMFSFRLSLVYNQNQLHMKKMTLLIIALSFSIAAMAQISVTGIVTNDSIPLESANVIIKNSTKGIATNRNGKFNIEAKKGDTLSISYLGYKTKEVVINERDDLKVKLEEGFNLNEVVIIACGSDSCRRTISCGFSVSFETILSNKIVNNKLYPNPSSNGIFQLKLNEDYDEVKISIATLSGRIIQNSQHQKIGEKVTIDLSEFSTGIYIVNIVADGKQFQPIKAVRS